MNVRPVPAPLPLDGDAAGDDPAPGSTPSRVERCPRCRTKLLEELPGAVVIRNAILRVDCETGGVKAKCPRCKTWVEVPLRYTG